MISASLVGGLIILGYVALIRRDFLRSAGPTKTIVNSGLVLMGTSIAGDILRLMYAEKKYGWAIKQLKDKYSIRAKTIF